MYTTECKICGKLFSHKFPQQNVCEPCKNRPCEICGKPFKRTEPYDQKYCSKQCRSAAKKDPERNKEWTAKRIQTLESKYGVSNIAKLDSIKAKIINSKLDPSGYEERRRVELNATKDTKQPVIRKCVICGEEFEAVGSQTTCSRPHYRNCIICGKPFEFKHISDTRVTCSIECENELRKKAVSKIKKICQLCGKEFYAKSGKAKYCKGPHFSTCEMCGKQFEINPDNLTHGKPPKTCSVQCRNNLSARTTRLRYKNIFNLNVDAKQVIENKVREIYQIYNNCPGLTYEGVMHAISAQVSSLNLVCGKDFTFNDIIEKMQNYSWNLPSDNHSTIIDWISEANVD